MKNTLMFTFIYLNIFLKNRKSAVVLWLAPILFLFGIAILSSQLLEEDSRVESFKVAIVNEDQTFETQMVIRQLTEGEHLQTLISTLETDKESAEALLHQNEIVAIIHIPENFSRDVAYGKNTPVTLIGNEKRPLQSQLIRHVMESAADFTSAAQSGINTVSLFMEEANFSEQEKSEQFKRDILSFALHVLGRGELFEHVEQHNLFQKQILHYYALSFYVLLIMIWSFMALFLLKTNVNNSIYERLISFGVQSAQLVCARFFAGLVLVTISSLFVSIPTLVWLGVENFSEIAQLVGTTLFITFVFLSIFIALEVFFVSEKIHLFMSLLVIVLGLVIGEHFIPTVYYPEWLANLNAFSLNGWILKWLFSLVLGTSNYSSIEIGLGLFLFAAGCLAISGMLLQRDRERI